MTRRARLLTALLLLLVAVGVCAAQPGGDTMLTAFRAAQAAAVILLSFAVISGARSGRTPAGNERTARLAAALERPMPRRTPLVALLC